MILQEFMNPEVVAECRFCYVLDGGSAKIIDGVPLDATWISLDVGSCYHVPIGSGKHVLCSSLPGEMIQFDEHIF